MASLQNNLYNVVQQQPEIWNFLQEHATFGYLLFQKNELQDAFLSNTLKVHLAKVIDDFDDSLLGLYSYTYLEENQTIETEFSYSIKALCSKTGKFQKIESNNSTIILVVFPLRDITIIDSIVGKYRFSLEEKLRISESAFKNNFENAAIGMAIITLDGKWHKVNNRISSMLGYTKEELSKLTFQEITFPEDLEKDLGLLKKLTNGNIPYYQMEKRYFHKSGKIVYGILAVSMVHDEKGNPLYFISQVIDITASRAAEEKIKKLLHTSREQNERLHNFAHIVTHNLRSHSSNFSMLLELYQTENEDKEEILKLLIMASDNLKETIHHLTEIVNLNSSIEEKMETIDLYPEVEKVIESVHSLAEKDDVNLINDIPKGVKIFGVPAYLNSIFLNFITNGIKYSSPERESFVKISAEKLQDYTEISIADNGLGINLDKHGDKLFGMYKTFHDHEDSRGIGLFIAKNQIDALNGKVKVESTENKGTTFKIYLKNE
ncbi:sensor histidine kinase [Mesonia maritima]|uniref:histidine kinase n=1 Tax=Mesonia maritima TaxID=1793873 RepID=A0ABU1K5L0_9FLAO|nr:PAS domain S-box protein [Mesonia maritima]MDR6300905.1 PAS domain S-box-containing protein [Mesonia maritima]